MKYLLFSFFTALLACTSALEKECKNKNWYEHGSEVANNGKRPSADSLVQQCRKKEYYVNESDLDKGFKEGVAQYCSPAGAYQTGKIGEFLNTELCYEKIPELTQKHSEGVKAFCQPESATQFGLSGKKYKQICPPDLEGSFLTHYNKARLKYLENLISSKERLKKDNDKRLAQHHRDLQQNEWQLSRLRTRYIQSKEKVYVNGKAKYETKTIEDPTIRTQRDILSSDIDSLRVKIHELNKEQNNLKLDIENLKVELSTLESSLLKN